MADVETEVAAGQPKKRTFKKFSFRGVDLDALLDMSTDELVKLFNARARRSSMLGSSLGTGKKDESGTPVGGTHLFPSKNLDAVNLSILSDGNSLTPVHLILSLLGAAGPRLLNSV